MVRAAQSALPSNVLHVWDDACPGPSAVHSMASAVAFAKSQFRWTMARSPFFGLLMWINGSQTPTSVFLESGEICVQVPVLFFALLVFWSAGVGIASTQSSGACDSYARSYAQNGSRQGQVLRGGAIGSLVGLGLGSIGGAAGTGAAIGAGLGMIGGGVKRAGTADRLYRDAYNDCMAGR